MLHYIFNALCQYMEEKHLSLWSRIIFLKYPPTFHLSLKVNLYFYITCNKKIFEINETDINFRTVDEVKFSHEMRKDHES